MGKDAVSQTQSAEKSIGAPVDRGLTIGIDNQPPAGQGKMSYANLEGETRSLVIAGNLPRLTLHGSAAKPDATNSRSVGGAKPDATNARPVADARPNATNARAAADAKPDATNGRSTTTASTDGTTDQYAATASTDATIGKHSAAKFTQGNDSPKSKAEISREGDNFLKTGDFS